MTGATKKKKYQKMAVCAGVFGAREWEKAGAREWEKAGYFSVESCEKILLYEPKELLALTFWRISGKFSSW